MINRYSLMYSKHPILIFSGEDVDFSWIKKDDLHYPFVQNLRFIYWSETYLMKVFNKIIKSADSDNLKKIFTNFLSICQERLERLEQIFSLKEEVAKAKKCYIMDCVINNTLLIIKNNSQKNYARDIDLALSFQQILFMKIANYEELIEMENRLVDEQIILLLKENLEVDKQHLDLLFYFAKGDCNALIDFNN